MAAGNPRTLIAVDDLVADAEASAAWIGGPSAAAVDAVAAYPVSRLGTNTLDRHRSTGITAAKGRIGRSFAAAKRVGAVSHAGHGITQTGLVRYIGGDYAFADSMLLDGTAPNVLASTTANLTATSAATFRIVCRHRPIDGVDDRDDENWFWFGTDAANPALYDWKLSFPGVGVVGVVATFARYSGSIVEIGDTSEDIDDGTPREYIVTLNGTAASLYIRKLTAAGWSGGLVGSATVPAFAGGASQGLSIGAYPARMEICHISRVTALITDFDDLRRNIAKYQLASPVWDMSGTAAVVDDVGPGTHTGTVGGTPVRGVEIATAVEPQLDTGTTEAWGDWGVRQALRVGTTGSVSHAMATTLPRSMTVTWWTRIDPAWATRSLFYRMLWVGATAATASVEFTIAANLRIGTTRAGGAQHIVNDLVDGEWHFCQADLLGRGTSSFAAYIDGVLVGTGAGGTYASAASWSVAVAGNVETSGFEIADVRVYGTLRGSTAIDYRATVPPWDEPELLVELPLNGHYRDSVSGVAATTGGDLEWVEWTNPDPDALPPPGVEQGHRTSANLLSGLPAIIASDFGGSSALCLEAAALIWDPDQGDAYHTAAALRWWAPVTMASGRGQNAQLRNVCPDSTFLPGGGSESQTGARGLELTVSWPSLSLTERDALHAAFRRVGRELPFLIISTIWTDEQRVFHAVWGTAATEFQSEELATSTTGRYRASIGIRSLLAEPLRL